MSVHEVASDVGTSGHAPRYALFDLNLPPKISDRTFEEYWKAVSKSCAELGVSIVGGHTGRFEGCDYTIAGSATMWTSCDKDEYLASSMAKDRDDLILTKSAAYGATAVLSRVFPRTVRRTLGSTVFRELLDYFDDMDTVEDSLAAVEVGIHDRGVTAIHDATEGGVLAAVYEMAAASKMGCNLYIENIPVSEATMQVSRLFHIDPMTSLGEGSLLIACRPDKTNRVLRRLKSKGTSATVIGQVSSKLRRVRGVTKNGTFTIAYPTKDPYWKAYSTAVRKGWS
jgi:hydrogenase maturation factor